MELLVVSSYPEKNLVHGTKTVGGASYAKNTLIWLKRVNPNLKITVLAEKWEKSDSYIENDIGIKRVWKRGNIFSILNLCKTILSSSPKTVLVEFEIFMLGSVLHTFIFLAFLMFVCLLGKRIVLVLHQVVSELSVFEKNAFKRSFIELTKDLFYKLILVSANRIVVFEEEFKKRLGSNEKVVVIPHAVENKLIIDKNEAKKKLGLDPNKKYALYFGFLSPYKGIDTLVDIWPQRNDLNLIIAGGPNPNHVNNKSYMSFVNRVLNGAKNKDILTAGFIPENQIELYYSACEILILPYKVFISSSGPLSLAFSYEKPILLSKSLQSYFNSTDLRQALNDLSLTSDDICFALNKDDFSQKLNFALEQCNLLSKFAQKMKEERSWERIGILYNEVLTQSYD